MVFLLAEWIRQLTNEAMPVSQSANRVRLTRARERQVRTSSGSRSEPASEASDSDSLVMVSSSSPPTPPNSALVMPRGRRANVWSPSEIVATGMPETSIVDEPCDCTLCCTMVTSVRRDACLCSLSLSLSLSLQRVVAVGSTHGSRRLPSARNHSQCMLNCNQITKRLPSIHHSLGRALALLHGARFAGRAGAGACWWCWWWHLLHT